MKSERLHTFQFNLLCYITFAHGNFLKNLTSATTGSKLVRTCMNLTTYRHTQTHSKNVPQALQDTEARSVRFSTFPGQEQGTIGPWRSDRRPRSRLTKTEVTYLQFICQRHFYRNSWLQANVQRYSAP